MEWVNVSVFISSTFNDMHAERDLLLKKVFPELSEWCSKRRIRLFDIDLRWGVTAADSQSKNTVDVCLQNIDECRPFFLCFLGQRRGWVPKEDGINSETIKHYPGITDRIGMRSVTEMEIEHALLSPMMRMVEGKTISPEASERSLFFIRDKSYLSSLNAAQLKLFTNAGTENEAETDRVHAAFVERVRNEWNQVYDYTCRFDRSIYSAELRELGDDIAQGRLSGFAVQGEPMDRVILETLKAQILKAYPEREEETAQESDETERQELKAEEVRRGTMEREAIAGKLTSYCENPDGRILYVYGKSGSGKTTLLSWFAEKEKNHIPNVSMHFCGISPVSMRWEQIWRAAGTAFELEERIYNSDQERITDTLRKIRETGEALIIIDGVDELSDGLSCLSSLPSVLPDGVRLIVSFRSDSEDAESLIHHLGTLEHAALLEVGPLSSKEEILDLIHTYLQQYLKALDDEQIQAITENRASGNPLFLKILLRELRVFGSYDQLSAQINAYGGTPDSAFERMLMDLEQEISYNPVPASEFVPQLAGLLSRVRGTVPVPVLKQALHTLLDNDETDLSDTLSFYLRRLAPYLTTDGIRYGISYHTLQNCAVHRYEALSISQHEALAQACRSEEPLECMYHYRMAGNYSAIRTLSEDLPFLCKVIQQSGALELLNELREAARHNSESVSEEVLRCLSETAALMKSDPQTAAALFYKELKRQDLRECARAICRAPWLRYEPVVLPAPKETDTAGINTVFSIGQEGCQGFCAAPEWKALYLLKGESDICVCGLEDGAEHASFSLPGTGRIRKIVCSYDGTLLGAVSEDLTLYMYRITLDHNLSLLAQSVLHKDQCGSVRFGGISLFGTEDGILWQRPDGTVVLCRCDSGKPEEQGTVPDKLTGWFAGGTIWKSGSSYLIRSGDKQVPVPARVNDVCRSDGALYAALENNAIVKIDIEKEEILQEYPLPAESAGSLACIGGTLYGADRYGALFRIQNGSVEELGRITEGDNILDTDGKLLDLGEERIAFVSMQRRALLSTDGSTRGARLFRVMEGKTGLSFLFGQKKNFTAVLPSGSEYTLPYPDYLLEGRNVNETNNLKAAASDDTLAYEENRVGIHYLGPDGTFELQESGVSEMGGILSDFRYVPQTDTFRAVTYRSQYLETDTKGNVLFRVDLPQSDSNLTLLCPCGTKSAVLSRRVRIKEDPSASAYITDVLSMIEAGKILWKREIARAEAQVSGILYDAKRDLLAVCYSTARIELVHPEDGATEQTIKELPVSFLQGAALHEGMIYSAGMEDDQNLLTVRALDGTYACSLVSQRRVREIMKTTDGVLVQEGDETLFRVVPETGR